MARTIAVALLMAATWLAIGAATASAQSRQTATATFDSRLPGTSTGVTQRIDYFNPDDPEAKPPAVATIVVSLADGSRIDTSIPPQCKASDAELIANGSAACPQGSIVGGGEIDLDTGIPGPGRIVSNQVELINNADELIFVLTEDQTGGHLAVRAEVSQRTVTTVNPPVPGGPPDGFTAIKRVRLQMGSISTAQGNYITTPTSCPTSGVWTATGEFTYRDDVTQLTSSTSPCVPLPASCKSEAAAPQLAERDGGTLTGSAGEDLLIGLAGNDLEAGRGGDDCLYGNDGKDALRGNKGDDLIEGGNGRDDIKGNKGADLIEGGDGFDRLRGAGGKDTARGGSGSDTLNGGDGRDRLSGGDGGDRLRGGDGNDVLNGGGGNDILRSGGGSDTIRCGSGRDKVVVTSDGRDRIADSCERIIRR